MISNLEKEMIFLHRLMHWTRVHVPILYAISGMQTKRLQLSLLREQKTLNGTVN